MRPPRSLPVLPIASPGSVRQTDRRSREHGRQLASRMLPAPVVEDPRQVPVDLEGHLRVDGALVLEEHVQQRAGRLVVAVAAGLRGPKRDAKQQVAVVLAQGLVDPAARDVLGAGEVEGVRERAAVSSRSAPQGREDRRADGRQASRCVAVFCGLEKTPLKSLSCGFVVAPALRSNPRARFGRCDVGGLRRAKRGASGGPVRHGSVSGSRARSGGVRAHPPVTRRAASCPISSA